MRIRTGNVIAMIIVVLLFLYPWLMLELITLPLTLLDFSHSRSFLIGAPLEVKTVVWCILVLCAGGVGYCLGLLGMRFLERLEQPPPPPSPPPDPRSRRPRRQPPIPSPFPWQTPDWWDEEMRRRQAWADEERRLPPPPLDDDWR